MAAIESQLIDAGITPLAGVDEAGRGACAGPLVIASVVLHDPFSEDLAAGGAHKQSDGQLRQE